LQKKEREGIKIQKSKKCTKKIDNDN
jgi:hypothetical protein